jgi:hypothetical protein
VITDYTNRFGVNLAPTPKNDPKLLAPVKVRVRWPFSVAGRRVEPDQVLELPRFDAESMRALGRVQIIEG